MEKSQEELRKNPRRKAGHLGEQILIVIPVRNTSEIPSENLKTFNYGKNYGRSPARNFKRKELTGTSQKSQENPLKRYHRKTLSEIADELWIHLGRIYIRVNIALLAGSIRRIRIPAILANFSSITWHNTEAHDKGDLLRQSSTSQ